MQDINSFLEMLATDINKEAENKIQNTLKLYNALTQQGKERVLSVIGCSSAIDDIEEITEFLDFMELIDNLENIDEVLKEILLEEAEPNKYLN